MNNVNTIESFSTKLAVHLLTVGL